MILLQVDKLMMTNINVRPYNIRCDNEVNKNKSIQNKKYQVYGDKALNSKESVRNRMSLQPWNVAFSAYWKALNNYRSILFLFFLVCSPIFAIILFYLVFGGCGGGMGSKEKGTW